MELSVEGRLRGLTEAISDAYLTNEAALIEHQISEAQLDEAARRGIEERAGEISRTLREERKHLEPVDALLMEYGLSTDEGVTLMRLAEGLIRTPDARSAYQLMRDKLGDGDWGTHKGQSASGLVNTATFGLQLSAGWIKLTGGVAASNLASRLGDSVLHTAVTHALALMGEHFVLGRSMEDASKRAAADARKGYVFSYDMLGEAAYTDEDAARYFAQYEAAANFLAEQSAGGADANRGPGLSVKLSALHPRYEYTRREDCVPVLVERVLRLAGIASRAGFGLAIDAEEAERLEVSLLVIERLLAAPELADWNGLGIVVQANQRRAGAVIDWLTHQARTRGRKVAVRLVKGAYWDMEIKRAQELGLASYPVFTRKENTDVNYIACARKLLGAPDVIFPQFATHNVHTATAVMMIAEETGAAFEFQRLHGMGQDLHDHLVEERGLRSRIYAPVGQHVDLLPYLVRRLLENGANSSFVNQLSDESVSVAELVRDPFGEALSHAQIANEKIPAPLDYLGTGRRAGQGLDWTQARMLRDMEQLLSVPPEVEASSIIGGVDIGGEVHQLSAPFDPDAVIGSVAYAETGAIDEAVAGCLSSDWATGFDAEARAACLHAAADLVEEHRDRFISLCVYEAGKTVPDAIAEIREAVDFLRYYAGEATGLRQAVRKPLGIVACISPWNFPLAIFLGQIGAALSVGNTVIAKPAEQTPLIAYEAVRIMQKAGVPASALHLLIGDGAELGSYLTSHASVDGVCFTGSTRTAKLIAGSLVQTGRALTPLIAETGGVNAMIVDSTALIEQAVEDVVASAFQSAGQRCSACRLVCVQEEIADNFIDMLSGAITKLAIAAPTHLRTDLGPVIDEVAEQALRGYVNEMNGKHKLIGRAEFLPEIAESAGSYVAPMAFEVGAVSDVTREVFGPILHVVRYKAARFDELINDINALGYGLTLGLHTRIDARIDYVAKRAHVGNLYANRNQIGAVVGVQPFGGEGLSGTGPKAGGPHYLLRLSRLAKGENSDKLEAAMSLTLPGPTGETNELGLYPRGTVLCLGGDDPSVLRRQVWRAVIMGNRVLVPETELAGQVLEGAEALAAFKLDDLLTMEIDAVACDGTRALAVAEKLSLREGAILPVLSAWSEAVFYAHERTVTVNTAAAGGNATLLAMT